ncbi:MAG: hypothetical protein SFT68_01910 [Rickettsiaceae bacterium]|nr:hypothetical protein [Rickettsiaceae bacterium]
MTRGSCAHELLTILLDPLFQGDDKGELRPRAPNHPPGSPFTSALPLNNLI